MRPRGFVGTWCLLAAFTGPPFGIIMGLLLALMNRRPDGPGAVLVGLGAGLFFGVTFGFVMSFLFQARTVTLPLGDDRETRARVNVALAELGYHPRTEAASMLTYKPSVQAGLLAGAISVQLGERESIVVGPSFYVGKLLRKLA